MTPLSVERRRKNERPLWRNALLASLFVHLCILIIGIGPLIPEDPFGAAGPKTGDDQAAGGLQLVGLAQVVKKVRIPPRVPVISEVEVVIVEFDDEPNQELEGLLGERPGLEGLPGIENGRGSGDGGTSDSGRSLLIPPVPRGMIIPPTNRALRGTEVQVWVFVDRGGRVVADSTRLDPPTSDRGFNRRLKREASGWVFTPARRSGEAVPSWFPYTISMD